MRFIPLPSRAEAFTTISGWGDSRALQRMMQLAWRCGSRSVVVLEDPECAEWAQEFEAFFSHIQTRLEGNLELLLFPAGAVASETELESAIGKSAMIGYAIVRPSPLGSVAEGIIDPRPSSDVHYVTCQSHHNVELAGARKSLTVDVRGIPFMQQDRIVSSCAHASLWIATSLVAGSYPEWTGCQVATCDLINEALKLAWPARSSRRLPTAGLHFEEIMLILERAGYDPIPYKFETEAQKARSDHTVYRWVESGLPVILLLELERGGHSVVVCGHTFDPDAWWPGAQRDYFPSLASEDLWYSSSLWAVQYLVVDDNYGPSLAMTRGSLRTRTKTAIVPLPKSARVYLHPEDAEFLAANFLFSEGMSDWLAALSGGGANSWVGWVSDALTRRQDKPVLRTFLVNRNDLIKHIKKSSGYADQARDLFARLTLPEKVWLVEVSLPFIYGDKQKVGEVVIDPGVPLQLMRTGLEPLLWVHLPQLVWSPQLGRDAVRVGPEGPSDLMPR